MLCSPCVVCSSALAISLISMRTSEVFSPPDWFCDNTASDLCSQHLQYSPWIILQQHFSLFLSSLCGGLGWLLTPFNLFGDPGSIRFLGLVPHNWNYQVFGTLQEELWLVWGRSDTFAATAAAAAGLRVMGCKYVRDWSCLGVIEVTFSRMTSGKYLDFSSSADVGDLKSCLREK